MIPAHPNPADGMRERIARVIARRFGTRITGPGRHQAADSILAIIASQLSPKEAEIERLMAALEPFAKVGREIPRWNEEAEDFWPAEQVSGDVANLEVGDFRRAAEALRLSREGGRG